MSCLWEQTKGTTFLFISFFDYSPIRTAKLADRSLGTTSVQHATCLTLILQNNNFIATCAEFAEWGARKTSPTAKTANAAYQILLLMTTSALKTR